VNQEKGASMVEEQRALLSKAVGNGKEKWDIYGTLTTPLGTKFAPHHLKQSPPSIDPFNENSRGPNCKEKRFIQNRGMTAVLHDITIIRLTNLHPTEPKTNEITISKITISKMLPIELRRKRT